MRAGGRQDSQEEGEEPLIVYVDIKRELAFPLNLTATPRGDTDATNAGAPNHHASHDGNSQSSGDIAAVHVPPVATATAVAGSAPGSGRGETHASAAGALLSSSVEGTSNGGATTEPAPNTTTASNHGDDYSGDRGAGGGPVQVSPLTAGAIVRTRRASAGAAHSMPRGVAEAREWRRRASLPGTCALSEGVRGCKTEWLLLCHTCIA
jgi:hypothetical protein